MLHKTICVPPTLSTSSCTRPDDSDTPEQKARQDQHTRRIHDNLRKLGILQDNLQDNVQSTATAQRTVLHPTDTGGYNLVLVCNTFLGKYNCTPRSECTMCVLFSVRAGLR